MPEIPALYSDPAARAGYLATHYWDAIDFADTAWVRNMPVFEGALPDYLVALGATMTAPDGPQRVRGSYDALLRRAAAQPALRDSITGLLEKYLYDPNSPMLDEELYIPALESIIASPSIDSLEKLRPRYQLGMAMKNRPGMPAADFAYELANGGTGRLYGIRAAYTLVFFYNPECHGCEEIRAEMIASRALRAQWERGGLKILAVYVDEDPAVWHRHLDEIPDWWISARDRGTKIRDNELYDLRAMPTLYLLNASKEVVFKDVPASRVDAYFAAMQ
jgi:thiol-disulfide isomerase/thioredoxin